MKTKLLNFRSDVDLIDRALHLSKEIDENINILNHKSKVSEQLTNCKRIKDEVIEFSNEKFYLQNLDLSKTKLKSYKYELSRIRDIHEEITLTKQNILQTIQGVEEKINSFQQETAKEIQQIEKNMHKLYSELRNFTYDSDDIFESYKSEALHLKDKILNISNEFICNQTLLEDIDSIIQYLNGLEEKRNKEKQLKLLEEKKEDLKIVDLSSNFDDLSPESLNLPRDSIDYIKYIEKEALKFQEKIRNFSNFDYTIDYFVLDENLMRLIEFLDKVKADQGTDLLNEKVSVLNYIKKLHDLLDSRVIPG